MLENWKSHSYGRSEWAKIHLKSLGDSVALTRNVIVRYKTDGDELERVSEAYALRRTDEGWKIAMVRLLMFPTQSHN